MPHTLDPTFPELLALATDDLKPIAERLRALVLELDPDAHEVVRLGDKATTLGVGPKKMSEGYVYIMPHAKWVNLGFYKGASLADEAGLMEGTGKQLRHIKMRSMEGAERPEVATLIRLAIAERKAALGKA